MFLEDGDWNNARVYLDRVLDINPEYAPAYVGKVMIDLKINKEEQIATCDAARRWEFEKGSDWIKAMRFASTEQKSVYEGYLEQLAIGREEERKLVILADAKRMISSSVIIKDINAEILNIRELGDIEAAKEVIALARERIAELVAIQYPKTKERIKIARTEGDFAALAKTFDDFGRYRNSEALKAKCLKRADKLRKKRIKKEKHKKRIKWLLIISCLVLAVLYAIGYMSAQG